MNTKERLKLFIEYKNLNVRQFENSIEVSNSYVSNIFNTIGHDVRNRISKKYTELNMDWLIRGEGEMLILKEEFGFASREKPSYTSSDGLQTKYILLLERTVASLERTVASLEAKIAELTKES